MKQHLNRNENTVPEKTESLPRDPLPPLVNHPAGKAAPAAVSRQTLCHCLPSQQAAARAMLGGSLRGLMYYMDVQAATGVDGWVETPRAVENLRDDRQRFIH